MNPSINPNVPKAINDLNLYDQIQSSDPSKIDLTSLPPGYDNLSANNPWRNMQYTQSFWDKVKGMLGFRTDAQKFSDEAFNNAQLYDAQLLQSAREEQYNSAQAQTERLRMAGINPDLAGDVNAGNATEFDNQAVNSPDTPNESNQLPKQITDTFVSTLQFLDTGVNTVIDILQKSLSFAKDLYGELGVTANDTDELNSWVDDLLGSQTNDAVRYTSDGHMVYVDTEGNEMPLDFDLKDSDLRTQLSKYVKFYSSYDEFVKNPKVRARFKTRYARERAWQAYRMRSTSPEFLDNLYSQWLNISKNRGEFNQLRASKFYSPNDAAQMTLVKPLVQLTDFLIQAEKRVQGEMYIFQGDYLTWGNDSNPFLDENGNLLYFGARRETNRTSPHFGESIHNKDGMTITYKESFGKLKGGADTEAAENATYREHYMQYVENAFGDAIDAIQKSNANDKEKAFLILLLEQARSKMLLQTGMNVVGKIAEKMVPGISTMTGETTQEIWKF